MSRAAPPSNPSGKKTVLVADDSASICADVRAVLEAEGYAVLEARDGEEALKTIRGNPDIALVICDLNMPFKNGMQVLESLRDEGRLKALPVVMLTTEGHLSVVAQARQAGATGWITKPLVPAHLVAVARKLAR
jgi:two-component system chemotaxis response regulator CheY